MESSPAPVDPHDQNGTPDADPFDGCSPAEIATFMSSRHRDVVTMLMTELKRAHERGSQARDRLAHTLVLLDEAQENLVRVARERDDLAKAKLDLQGEVCRLQAETYRVQHAYERRETVTERATDRTAPISPLMPSAREPAVRLPTRPSSYLTTMIADHQLSTSVSLSAEGHIAVARPDTAPARPACVVYTASLSMRSLEFVATIRSSDHHRVRIGISSAPLSGEPAHASLQCLLTGDGSVHIVCDGRDIETRVVPNEGSDSAETRSGSSRAYSVSWDATTRRICFEWNGILGIPLMLPAAFAREALCPVVWLPLGSDEVYCRRR
jgi:hypothetical protein